MMRLSHTYFVQDFTTSLEVDRLKIQETLVTQSMGAVLPEQRPLTRVLDVGCGTGGWLLKVAENYPDIPFFAGVDINSSLVAYARKQAEEKHLSDRVQFYVMDALRMLEFPSRFFDCINQRFGISYLRTWDWSKLLQEYRRVGKPECIVRITECESFWSNSQALESFIALLTQAFRQAGHLPHPASVPLIDQVSPLLERSGILPLRTSASTMETYQFGTETDEPLMKEYLWLLLQTAAPFIHKWVRLSDDDYQALRQRAVNDMRGSPFVATATLHSLWGSVY